MKREMLSRRSALGALAGAGWAAPNAAAWQSFYQGSDDPAPRQIALTAGPLTMVFEPELGFLRYLRYGDAEVIRGVYAAVRDRNWGTVTPKLSNLRVETSDRGFAASFDVSCRQDDIDFFWRGEITGEAAGVVRFRMEGDARSTFLRNRIGFCVLHPLKECAGRACTVTHTDGTREQGVFPADIAPHQPFLDLAGLAHEVAPGVTAEVTFDGEVFETEDHRNWTDASYKTYCIPLARPYPVEVKQGTKIRQAVTIALKGAPKTPAAKFRPFQRETELEVDSGAARTLPRVGFGIAGGAPALTPAQLQLLSAARPAHLRVDLHLAGSYDAPLQRAIAEARQLQAGLELGLHVEGDAEAQLRALAAKLATQKPRVDRCLLYRQEQVKTARSVLTAASFGCGTDAFFAELNRERPDPAGLDFVCYSINPQVHAFDNGSLVENLAAQADSVDSARKIAAGKHVVASPVTLRPRPATAAPAGSPPSSLDVRQMSLLGAAWTAGSLKHLAESGAHAVTYYETHGPLGLMELATGSPWPQRFPSQPSMTFPLFHVLCDFNEFAGGESLRCRSSQPLAVDALVLRKAGRQRALVANFTAQTQAARLAWPGASRRIRIRKLDEHSFRSASMTPEAWRRQAGDTVTLGGGHVELSLAPYAVARIDTAG